MVTIKSRLNNGFFGQAQIYRAIYLVRRFYIISAGVGDGQAHRFGDSAVPTDMPPATVTARKEERRRWGQRGRRGGTGTGRLA
jgi:hypothetical protein